MYETPMKSIVPQPFENWRLPALTLVSRFGFLGTFAKRAVARCIRFFIVYQTRVNDELYAQIRDVGRRTESCERAIEQLKYISMQLSALDDSLGRTRAAVAAMSTALPQQISMAHGTARSAHDAALSLQADHNALSDRVNDIANQTAAVEDQLLRWGPYLMQLLDITQNDRLVEITTSHLDETRVRFGEPAASSGWPVEAQVHRNGACEDNAVTVGTNPNLQAQLNSGDAQAPNHVSKNATNHSGQKRGFLRRLGRVFGFAH